MNRDFELSDAGSRANLEYWTELQRIQLMQIVKVNQEIKRCISSLARKQHPASLSRKQSVVFNAALCDND